MKTLLIFEDSGKARWGGGQKITLEVMHILKDQFHLVLLDNREDSILKERARKLVVDQVDLIHRGRIAGSPRSSFSLGLQELVLTPFLEWHNRRVLSEYVKKHQLNKEKALSYATTKKGLLLAYYLYRRRGIPYVYHAHSFDDRTHWLYRVIERPLREAAVVIAVSRYVGSNLRLPQVQVVYNPGPSVRGQVKQLPQKGPIVVASMGTLTPLKGIDVFMKSHQYLARPQEVALWIYGEGDQRTFLETLETEQVVLKGFTPQALAVLREDIHVLVLPSVVPEAGSLILVEALRMGLPVVATNHGGQAELLGSQKVGVLVEPGSPQALAQGIDELIRDAATYEAYAKRALAYSESFNPAHYASRIKKLFAPYA